MAHQSEIENTKPTKRKKQEVRKKKSHAQISESLKSAQSITDCAVNTANSVTVYQSIIKRVWWSKTPLELYHFDQIPHYLQDSRFV